MCHGAGGLAAHHAMGSRSGWSIAIFGITCLVLAALFGAQVTHLLTAVPMEVVAVLVLFASWHLAEPTKILKVRPSCQLIIAAMTVVALWGGLMTALVVGVALEWSLSKYAQRRATP
jgi:MFS superfamily sulfate permease-like transporter